MLTTIDVNILNALAVLGILFAIPRLYRTCDLFWLYFLRPSSVGRYLHGKTPYAIVTGATDGIGKATAAELLTRGLSLILHGRNETKMQKEKVVHELRALAAGNSASAPDIRYFIADATGTHARPGEAALAVPGPARHRGRAQRRRRRRSDEREVRLPFRTTSASRRSEGSHRRATRLGSTGTPKNTSSAPPAGLRSSDFALLLTRALLPQLRRAAGAQCGPVCAGPLCRLRRERVPPAVSVLLLRRIQSVPQGARARPGQRRAVIAIRAPDRGTSLVVGSVHSANHAVSRPPGFWVPTSTSTKFVRSRVESLGCGRRTMMTPYVVHAVEHWLKQLWGDRAADEAGARYMRKMMVQAVKRK